MSPEVATDALDALLRGEFPDPDGGPPIGVPVRAVVIERSLRGIEADIVASLPVGRRLAIVSDATTRAVLGERVERALASVGTVIPIVLEGEPHADAETVATRPPRLRIGRCAGRRRVRNHQRPVQVRGGEGRQALRGLRDRAVDERLHVDECRDHRRRPQEVARGRGAAGRLHGPRGAGAPLRRG